MDVDAIQRRGRNQNRGAGAGRRTPGKGKNDNKQQGQRREAAPKPPPKNQNAPKRGCYNCGDEGHRVRDCSNPRKVAAITRGHKEEEEEDTEPEHYSYEREPTSESEDDDWDPDRVVAALEGSYQVTPTGTKRRRNGVPTQTPQVRMGTQGDGSGTVTIEGQMVHVPKLKVPAVKTALKENAKKELGPGELRRIVQEALSGNEDGRDETC